MSLLLIAQLYLPSRLITLEIFQISAITLLFTFYITNSPSLSLFLSANIITFFIAIIFIYYIMLLDL